MNVKVTMEKTYFKTYFRFVREQILHRLCFVGFVAYL